jgi:thiosulfate/3-mercaptopyruvate sulfurtransferase
VTPESLGVAIAVTPDWVASRATPGDGEASARARVHLIDTRPVGEFVTSRIPGAILAPADSASSLEALEKMIASRGLTGEETLVCYADRASIADAAHVFWLLELAGAPAVRFLDGGIEAWEASGRALERGSQGTVLAALPAVRWRLAPDSSRFGSLEYVRDHFGEKEVEILDARGALAWESPEGDRFESQWGRAGHIPHSLPFEFRQMFHEDGALLPVDELRKAIRRAGPRPATPVSLESEFIVYDDGSGREAALGYLVARAAGVERARCFPDGWARWSADPALPVVRIVDTDTIEMRVAEAARGGRPTADSESADHILFDMRTTNDYKSGHIPGAVLLAAHQFEDSLDVVVGRRWPGVDRSRVTLTAYCYGPDCIRSRSGCTWAARRGFLHLEWFRGGIAEWESAKNPLVLGPSPSDE